MGSGRLTNFLPQKRWGGGAYWEEGAYNYLSAPSFNIRDWEGDLIEDLRHTWHDPVRKISSSAAKPLRYLGLRVRQVLEILLECTYSYPKFPVLWGRRMESKTARENRRQRSQTIWGLGSFAPARYGGNNQKWGKRENIHNKGIWV